MGSLTMVSMTPTLMRSSEEIEALEARVEELRVSIFRNLTRWQRVQIARHPLRPYTLDYIEALTDGFVEMRGDRTFRDDPAIVGGFATFQGERYGSRNRTVLRDPHPHHGHARRHQRGVLVLHHESVRSAGLDYSHAGHS